MSDSEVELTPSEDGWWSQEEEKEKDKETENEKEKKTNAERAAAADRAAAAPAAVAAAAAAAATKFEHNEYGKVVVPRGQPFRSSSIDVLQSTFRCNTDYQYQKRAVPETAPTEHGPATSPEDAAGEIRPLASK